MRIMDEKPPTPDPVPATAPSRVRHPIIGDDMKSFVDRLLTARKFRELGSRELSTRAGLSAGAVSEIESLKVQSVTLRTAYKLADALDVRRSWLLCGEGSSDKNRKVK